jgi:hypothetical protein
MRWITGAIPINLALVVCLSTGARAQEVEPIVGRDPAAAAARAITLPAERTVQLAAGAAGPRRTSWGASFSAVQPGVRARDALNASSNRTMSTAAQGPMKGFGLVDMGIGAANGALWGLLVAALRDDVVAGEGASWGAAAGAVSVTAIWALFGPIF